MTTTSLNLCPQTVSLTQEATKKTSSTNSDSAATSASSIYSSAHSSLETVKSGEDLEEAASSSPKFVKKRTVTQYKVIKTIGRGQYAKVKLARDVSAQKDVAIKVILKADLNANRIRKLAREIKIMKLLKHPNVVEFFEAIETETSHCLVMEYVCGGELFDYVKVQGKLNEKDARAIFRQLVAAVDYCHDKGVIHRDLKTENILLDSQMNVKLADFGLSNLFTSANKLKTLCGTPTYLAPEIFLGRKYGVEVDVWSLGVILYVLVTGCFPFDDSSIQQLRKEVLNCNYIIPEHVSASCRILLGKILVLDPLQRANIKFIMENDWFKEGYEGDSLKACVEPEQDI